ncbi:MAG: YfhO family protein [Chloroflexia bacterium]|nr:YfhO family protein [Chloroflexia bacterium]
MRAPRSTTIPIHFVATRRADAAGALLVIFITLVAVGPLLIGGTVVGQDTIAFFAPMYGFLGDRLRAGEVPVWNPYQFAGAPFLADPESGWLYWPAMILFALLPVAAAVPVYLLVHLLIAGLATYTFGRLFGLNVTGAVTAAAAYELSGLVYGRSVCCPAYVQVAAWLPVALVATELALRTREWSHRLGWCWLGAFAVSQIIASWLGQGSYYALLVIGGFVLYGGLRTQDSGLTLRRRLIAEPAKRAWLVGALIVGLGVVLAAAAILPRFEFRAVSTLAEGYGDDLAWAARQGGWGPGDLDDRLFAPGLTYAGGAVAMLILVAVARLRQRTAVPFFALMALGTLLLTTTWVNPLQILLFLLLPEFEQLHRHWPERAMVVFFLAPAMLAGVVVSEFAGVRRIGRRLAMALAIGPLAMLAARLLGAEFHPLAIGGAALSALIVAWSPKFTHRSRRFLPAALGAILTLELLAAGLLTARDGPYGGFHRLDLADYFQAGGAEAFIAADGTGQTSRFFGYDPEYREIESRHGQVTYYRYHFAEPGTRALLVNNLGTAFALADVQGYNPLQMQHYVDFMAELNGVQQEYHGSWVLPTGLDSPLLDLLGVRYVIVPAVTPTDRPEIERLARSWPVVYRNAAVRVLENPDAFPRAWLVHDAVPGNADTLARSLADGSLDLRTTAVVDGASPEIAAAADLASERVGVSNVSPESITLQVTASAPALLVTSEVDYPAWQAYLDGEPVSTIRANVAFRAVAVPAGQHTVTFRYESDALTTGLLISGVGYMGALATLSVLLARHVRRRRATA